MEIIYKNDWMQIKRKNERYIIQYNTGDLANSINEIEVSKADADRAQESGKCAYEVILKYQNLQHFPNS